MQPIIYLFFDSTCAEAFRFYAEVFGTSEELVLMPASAAPGEEIPDLEGASPDLIMHGAVKIGSGWVYGSDDLSGQGTAKMAGASINLSLPDEAETRRIYQALSAGGEVRMPLEPAFFAPLFSGFTDRFGVRWMVMQDDPPQT